MSKLRSAQLALVLAIGVTLSVGSARAAEVFMFLDGEITDVENSPFAGGQTTDGVEIGDLVTAQLLYDDTTAQVSGPFVSYRLTDLEIVVPDTTQGGSFSLVPVGLNSATRIVFEGGDFHGLVLPNSVTGLGQIDAFDLSDLSFEAEGFNGAEFRFNLGVPVVEFFLPEPGFPALIATGSLGMLLFGRKRIRC